MRSSAGRNKAKKDRGLYRDQVLGALENADFVLAGELVTQLGGA